MDMLEDVFNASASYVQLQSVSEEGKKLETTQLLELYGLYKSATIGPCNEQKPGIFNQKGRAKWDSWKQVSNLTKEEAQRSYIAKVKEFFQWIPPEIHKGGSRSMCLDPSSFVGGNSVSTFAKLSLEDEEDQGNNHPIFSWAKDNNVTKIAEWLEQGNDANIKDDKGLTVLHWVVDRGHVEACKLLLENGADPCIEDEDGQNSRDYAITCEHEKILKLLETQGCLHEKNSS